MSAGRWALFVSLALNLLLIGVIAGGAIAELGHQKAKATEAVARAPNMRALMESLPPARAAEVRSHVVETWRSAQAERQAARQARLEIARVAGADLYNAAAAKAAFAKMRQVDAAVASRFHDVVADAMASMTVEERRAMLRHLAQRRMEQRGMQGRGFGPPQWGDQSNQSNQSNQKASSPEPEQKPPSSP